MSKMQLPKTGPHVVLSVPQDKTLLIRLNRPEALNAMTAEVEADMCKVLDWFEATPSLWVCILTGTGRTFCAGQDLKGWLDNARNPDAPPATDAVLKNPHGFGSVSRRTMRKPLIAALNGPALGGGAEMLVRCDIIVGYEKALVSFPEVRRGVVASQGGIPHALHRSPQFAPYLLTGTPIPQPILSAHLFTETVASRDKTLAAALKWAKLVTECSPEAVMCTKDQINDWQQGLGVAEVARRGALTEETAGLHAGRNIREGLESFVEKRPSQWVDPDAPVRSKL